jgi:hypothetical protein
MTFSRGMFALGSLNGGHKSGNRILWCTVAIVGLITSKTITKIDHKPKVDHKEIKKGIKFFSQNLNQRDGLDEVREESDFYFYLNPLLSPQKTLPL